MRIALDTNILAYAEGLNGAPRKIEATRLLLALPKDDIVIPVQALGELFRVLTRKGARPPDRARAAALSWHDAHHTVETTSAVMLAAFDLVAEHRFSLWDAVMLNAAAEGGCRLLLSEDMQDGFTWRGVTIANPFAASPHPLLAGLLAG